MKKSLFILLILIINSCSDNEEKRETNMSSGFEEKILRQVYNDDGSLKIITSTAIIGGEDSYIKTEEFDKEGRLVKEYGYKPYGIKYKTIREYSDSLLTKEIEYVYSFQDSNYNHLNFYKSTDTLIEYPEIDSFISSIIQKSYYSNSVLKQNLNIIPKPKNAIECDEVEIKYIDNYNFQGQIISEYITFDKDTTNWQTWSYENGNIIEHMKYKIIYIDCSIPKDTIIEKIK